MLSKIFKKTETPAATKASETAKLAEAKKEAALQATQAAAQASAQVAETWQPKLAAAMGDDAALLSVAKDAPSVDLKLAAVMALTGEESLKLAEREFRTHDRRVHRAAKQRYEAMVSQREAREAAAKLIEAAATLVNEAKIPANRLVELDRAWLALDLALVHPAQRDEFAALAADLTTLTRERGEHQLHLNRWTAEARQVLLHLNVTAGDVAAGIKDKSLLEPPYSAAAALLKTIPEGAASAHLAESLQTSLQTSAQLEIRLALLDELLPTALVTATAEAAVEPTAEPVAAIEAEAEIKTETKADTEGVTVLTPTPVQSPALPPALPNASARWHALPPIADTQIARLLDARFDQWQNTQTDARKAHHAEKRNQVAEHKKAVKHERNLALAELLQVAETALADGHLAEMNKHLVAIDNALENGAPAGALRGRIDALQAEFARLKGWQHWGGGRVRDDLVLEAEALAKTVAVEIETVNETAVAENAVTDTTAIAEIPAQPAPDAPAESMLNAAAEVGTDAATEATNVATVEVATSLEIETPVLAATAIEPATAKAPGKFERKERKASPSKTQAKLPPKFSIKQHADAIEKLRERWKELDKLGGASSRSLWTRFDTALKAAYVPVATHLAKLKAVRQENLEARNKLVATLDAVKLAEPASTEANTEANPATQPLSAQQDYRELARALEHFQTEWRKMGPVEHTVPHKSREKLLERMRVAMARLETPLQEARHVAQRAREKFIVRAKTLVAEAAAKPQSRDIIPKIRELQTEWQQHAKTLPLARNIENALWAEFKAATDAVFTQRDAAFSARDQEFKASRDQREALIARLTGLTADTAAGEIKRTVADVDTLWRRGGEVKRDDAAKIDARFRAARAQAELHLAGSANRVWYATCDALNAKLALCAEAESAVPDSEIEARWQALSALPPVWEHPLQARLKAALAGISNAANPATLDVTLLQLESALDIPSPPASQAARRDLKLRALKAALEGKPTSGTPAGSIEQLLAEAFRFSHAVLDAAQQARLAAVLAAVRVRGHARG